MKMEGYLFKIYEAQRKQGFEREICNGQSTYQNGKLSEINNPSSHLWKMKKEEQVKTKASRGK